MSLIDIFFLIILKTIQGLKNQLLHHSKQIHYLEIQFSTLNSNIFPWNQIFSLSKQTPKVK